jgi:two-component system, response regulator YesN
VIRVLIVDDDKLARKGLISIMPWSDHGMVVVGEAANGAKALEFLEQHEVDLMFVDLSMPVMSGIELLQAVERKYPRLRSVMLTFHEEFENVQTAYRHGILDYISKVRLEQEDDHQILRRIRHKLMGVSPQNDSFPSSLPPAKPGVLKAESVNPLANEQWRRLEREWRSLYWLYDEEHFQRICTQTVESELPVRHLEGMLMRVISQVETDTRLNAEYSTGEGDLGSALEWVKRCRERIYIHVAGSVDLTSTVVCILKAVIYIREHVAGSLHAEEVAEHVNMSRSYFCQIFKKLTGSTFNVFLRKERIRTARRLLCETNRSVAWVANAVGYGDTKYFSHIFYEQTRLLPSEFRARSQRKGE